MFLIPLPKVSGDGFVPLLGEEFMGLCVNKDISPSFFFLASRPQVAPL
jgi:hypothetical protein